MRSFKLPRQQNCLKARLSKGTIPVSLQPLPAHPFVWLQQQSNTGTNQRRSTWKTRSFPLPSTKKHLLTTPKPQGKPWLHFDSMWWKWWEASPCCFLLLLLKGRVLTLLQRKLNSGIALNSGSYSLTPIAHCLNLGLLDRPTPDCSILPLSASPHRKEEKLSSLNHLLCLSSDNLSLQQALQWAPGELWVPEHTNVPYWGDVAHRWTSQLPREGASSSLPSPEIWVFPQNDNTFRRKQNAQEWADHLDRYWWAQENRGPLIQYELYIWIL